MKLPSQELLVSAKECVFKIKHVREVASSINSTEAMALLAKHNWDAAAALEEVLVSVGPPRCAHCPLPHCRAVRLMRCAMYSAPVPVEATPAERLHCTSQLRTAALQGDPAALAAAVSSAERLGLVAEVRLTVLPTTRTPKH